MFERLSDEEYEVIIKKKNKEIEELQEWIEGPENVRDVTMKSLKQYKKENDELILRVERLEPQNSALRYQLGEEQKTIIKLKNQPQLDEKEVKRILEKYRNEVNKVILDNWEKKLLNKPEKIAEIFNKFEILEKFYTTQLCKLQYKNQKVLAEGKVKLKVVENAGDCVFIGDIELWNYFEDNNLEGKRVIILEDNNEKAN